MINKLYPYIRRDREKEREEKKNLGAVIIDMQPGFLKDISEEDQEKLFKSQIKTLEICAKRNYPTAILEFDKHCYGGTDNKIKKAVEAIPRHVYFEKFGNDGFYKIEQQLKEWNIEKLCIMGISAAYCVKATASSAKKKGKEILTARELIASQTYRQEEFQECIPWFQKNTTYYQNYKELINHITS